MCTHTHKHMYTWPRDILAHGITKNQSVPQSEHFTAQGWKDSCYTGKLGNTKKWEWIFEIFLSQSNSNRCKFSIKMVFTKFTLSFLNQIPCTATTYKQICTGKNMADLQVNGSPVLLLKFCLTVAQRLLRYLSCICSFSSGSHWYNNPSENFPLK